MANRYKESNPVLFRQLEELVVREPLHYSSFLRGSCNHIMEWCLEELDAVGCHPSMKKVAVYLVLHGLTKYPKCAICERDLQDKDLVNILQGFHKTCSNACKFKYFSAVIATDEWRSNFSKVRREVFENMDGEAREKWLSSLRAYRKNLTQEKKDKRIQAYRDTIRNRTEEEKKAVSLHISEALQSMSPERKASWQSNVRIGLANLSQEAKEARNAKIGLKNHETYCAKTDEEKEKIRLTLRIASANRSQETIDRAVERCAETKRRNGTFNTSKPEQATYEMLIKVFGADNVIRQYKNDSRYPFSVDFYIKSLDLFIECNYSWTHKGRWFNLNSSEDRKEAEEMYQRYEKTGKRYYKNAADTWTIRDVKKHTIALQNNLNYLVFWNLEEAMNYDFSKWRTSNEEDAA